MLGFFYSVFVYAQEMVHVVKHSLFQTLHLRRTSPHDETGGSLQPCPNAARECTKLAMTCVMSLLALAGKEWCVVLFVLR